VESIIVFINKIDITPDKEIHELVEMEVRELLTKYDYDGDKAQVVLGSALSAMNGTNPTIGKERVVKLLDTMDEHIKIPVRNVDKPFMLSVESTF
jgi:elongation factor Tu